MQKDALIQLLKDCEAIKFGRFILTSGAVSDYYIDIKKASTNPIILKIIAQEMQIYTKGYDLIAGMELGAVPLVVALSMQTDIPYVIIRKECREHGTGKQIEGPSVKDKQVLIIEDVTTTGGSVIKSIQILRTNNAKVDKVVTVVDRGNTTKDKLSQLDIDFIPLIKAKEILKK
jgi:orotate phosphoribosyltransferase